MIKSHTHTLSFYGRRRYPSFLKKKSLLHRCIYMAEETPLLTTPASYSYGDPLLMDY